MKLKDIYKENLGRKYRNVINTKGKEIEIKSIPLESIKKNKYTILIISLIIILILLLTFHNTLNTFFVIIVFLLFMLATAIYFNNYSIKCQKDSLHLKWNFQNFDLPYERIKSIFVSRDISGLDVFPLLTYNIIIRYIDNMNFIRELSFPATLLNPEELHEFIDNFIVEEEKAQDCVKFEKLKRLKMIIKIAGFIIFIVLVAIVVMASFHQ